MENTRTPKKAIKGLIWEIGAPLVVYYPLVVLGLPIIAALAAATGIAVLRMAYVAVRERRLDGIALLMAAIFGVGLLLTLVTGDPRVMLLKDSVTTGLIALTFLGSCLVRRPVMFALIRRTLEGERRAEADARWGADPAYRKAVTLITAVWGVILAAEAAIRAVLVYTLPFSTVFGISHLLTLVAVGLALLWTVMYGARRKRRAAAATAAAAPAPTGRAA